MEQRNVILAIVLSGLVLFAYQAVFIAPKQTEPLKTPQTAVTSNINQANTAPAEGVSSGTGETTETSIKPIEYQIDSTNANILYTNVGGSLHKINFTGNAPFFVTDVLAINGLENATYTGAKLDNNTISLVYKNKDWQVTKIFQLKDDHLINVRMEIKNISEISILNNFSFTAFEIDDSRMEISQISSRDTALFEYSVYANNRIFRKGNASKFSDKNYKNVETKVNWLGFRDHYNAFIIKPEFETQDYEIKSDSYNQLNFSIKPQDQNLNPGESAVYNFSIYAGPQNPWIMKKYDQGFEKIVAFSNFPIIEWIAQAIYYAIPYFHSIFKSWGVAIILVSLLIYGMTYPLTFKSMMSMRKMQEIQPKIAALKERYKDDAQKLNTEMMEIYRREKINPFGGCLPVLIQMPFFMALYQILWRAQYFQGQGFLWIKDLSQPDRLIILPFYLPFLGNEINILPILTGIVMFLQQKINSKNAVVTDEQQRMQQIMMMCIFPPLMTWVFYKFASSWAIYFLVFYILSTLSQWKIAKMTAKK